MKIRDAAEFFRGSAAQRLRADRRPDDARTGRTPAGLSRTGRPGLPDARPHAADAQRRRGPARRADLGPGLQPGQHALRARRAVDRTAPPRHRPTDRRDPRAPRPAQHGRRRRARRVDHPRGRPGHRDRPRRRRTRRKSRLPGHARGNGTRRRKPDRRLPRRAAGHRRERTPPRAEPRLDPAGRRPGKQPAKHHGRVPARAACVW